MPPPTLRSMMQHRNLMVAFTRYVTQGRSTGLMNAALEMLAKVLPLTGALAYRSEEKELVLVADHKLPRRAKPWLAHLPHTPEGWFVAQKVAHSFKPLVDPQVAEVRMGHSIRPVLEEGGWKALAAAPIALGRTLYGVIVLAADKVDALDQDTMLLLETVSSLLAMAEDREASAERERHGKVDEAKTGQLATIGLLSSTAACDLAAPLGAMQLQVEDQAELLSQLRAKLIALGVDDVDEINELDELRDLGEVMSAGLRSAQGVTSRLLSFARESPKQAIDLSHVVESVVVMLEPTLNAAGIQLELDPGPGGLTVEGRQEVLQTLVVQLLLYAKQECEQAKAATVRVSLKSDESRHVLAVETSAGGGGGANIFETYLRRSSGPNVGLGLALAKQAVLAHRGHIEHGESELGGVLVRVVLPGTTAVIEERERRFESRPASQTLSRPAAAGGGPMILWIDEDELTAGNMRRGIRSHAVHTAGTLAEARALLAQGTNAEVIFCDVTLPDGSGIDLHQEAPEELQARFVFMTGGVIPADAASYLVSSGRPTLIKPVSLEEIAQLLVTPGQRTPSVAPTLESVPPPADDRAARRELRRQAATTEASPTAKHKGTP